MTTNPYATMLTTFNPDHVYGRASEINLILQNVKDKEPRSFAFSGNKLLGKTTILKKLEKDIAGLPQSSDYRNKAYHSQIVPVYVNFIADSSSTVLHSLYEVLSREERLKKFLPEQGKAGPQTNQNGLNAETIKPTLRYIASRLHMEGIKLVILLDHFDEVFKTMEYPEDAFLRYLASLHSFVIATEKNFLELRPSAFEASPMVGILIQQKIGLLSLPESRNLIQKPLEALPEEVKAKFEFSSEEVDFLLEEVGNHPYLLTLACEFLFNRRLQNLGDIWIDNEPVKNYLVSQLEELPAVKELFQLYWSRLSKEEQLTLLELTKEQPNLEQGKTLTILANKALIYEDFKNQKRPFRLFSNLFRNYIVRQSISNKLNNDALFNTILDSLAPLDRKLLVHLQSHSEKILSFEDLKSVWDDPSKVEKPTIEAALHRIRTVIAEKSGSKEKYLKNVRGKGYQFIP